MTEKLLTGTLSLNTTNQPTAWGSGDIAVMGKGKSDPYAVIRGKVIVVTVRGRGYIAVMGKGKSDPYVVIRGKVIVVTAIQWNRL